MTKVHSPRRDELIVLGVIVIGLIAILIAVVLGLFLDNNGLPNWAENVLVSIATACALKLGDAINALVALATGRQVESFGASLAQSAPQIDRRRPVPETAKDAAEQVSDAAAAEAEAIVGEEK